jgi:hypothetical protein
MTRSPLSRSPLSTNHCFWRSNVRGVRTNPVKTAYVDRSAEVSVTLSFANVLFGKGIRRRPVPERPTRLPTYSRIRRARSALSWPSVSAQSRAGTPRSSQRAAVPPGDREIPCSSLPILRPATAFSSSNCAHSLTRSWLSLIVVGCGFPNVRLRNGRERSTDTGMASGAERTPLSMRFALRTLFHFPNSS